MIDLCKEWNINFEECLDLNINKLKIRFPDKFTEENALNRDLVSERKANLMEFKNGIKSTGIELFEKKIRMTSGWKYTGSDNYNVRCYGFKRKEFVDKILGVKDTEFEPNE